MSEQKIYVGGGKKKFDNLRSISVCIDDLMAYATKSKNGKSYVNLNVSDKKEADQYGKDVSVSVDTWKPNQESAPAKDEPKDLPF